LLLSTFFAFFIFFNSVDASPLLPGGALTSSDLSKNAFGHPAKNITKEEKNQFFVGNSFFKQSWVAAPSSTDGRDGLGPTYNAVSCAACHPLDGRGLAYSKEKLAIGLLFRLQSFHPTLSHFSDHPAYGGQINPNGIENVPGEGRPELQWSKITSAYADGTPYEIRRPVFTFQKLSFGEFTSTTFISPRIGPQLAGLGLLEAIDEQEINEDPFDLNGDGISGRRSTVIDIATGSFALGRFGWRAEQPSVRQQTAGAFLGDLGITSSLFPIENCPAEQIECGKSINGGSPELDEKVLDRVTTYIQFLAPPKARHSDLESFQQGLDVFQKTGCVDCHTPSYTTAHHINDAFNNQVIYPFTDLLLHDMGPDLADVDQLFSLLPIDVTTEKFREWRTPPLWGIGLIPTVNGHQQLLHDGRANSVEEAILWHGGEAESARNKFKNLTKPERDLLVQFVNNL
jgi:CxxC motif-containing protein (DUF1111 family)